MQHLRHHVGSLCQVSQRMWVCKRQCWPGRQCCAMRSPLATFQAAPMVCAVRAQFAVRPCSSISIANTFSTASCAPSHHAQDRLVVIASDLPASVGQGQVEIGVLPADPNTLLLCTGAGLAGGAGGGGAVGAAEGGPGAGG